MALNNQESKLTISVIIVTYNREGMLTEALSSLTMQLRMPDEVIVVDNNSTDNTREVVKEFTSKLNIRYFFEGIQGTSRARNTGIKNASGDIIVFLDDDCIAQNEWLYYLERPFLRDPSIGIVGGEINACRVKGTLIEDFCIADGMLQVGKLCPKKEDAA